MWMQKNRKCTASDCSTVLNWFYFSNCHSLYTRMQKVQHKFCKLHDTKYNLRYWQLWQFRLGRRIVWWLHQAQILICTSRILNSLSCKIRIRIHTICIACFMTKCNQQLNYKNRKLYCLYKLNSYWYIFCTQGLLHFLGPGNVQPYRRTVSFHYDSPFCENGWFGRTQYIMGTEHSLYSSRGKLDTAKQSYFQRNSIHSLNYKKLLLSWNIGLKCLK